MGGFLLTRLLFPIAALAAGRVFSRLFGRRPGLLLAGSAGAMVASRLMKDREPFDFRGSVVAITGGSRGLGLALAEEFARRGARVALCARDPEELERARQRLEPVTPVLVQRCDVARQDEVEAFIRATQERFGHVDALVNNAGIMNVGPVETQTLKDFRTAMDVMFWGSVYAVMAVLPEMQRRRSGRLVNITSIGGKISAPHLLPYSCAKFATVGLSEGLRAELAKDGIVVTTVVPGFMRTGSYKNALFKGKSRDEYAWFSLAGNLPLTSTSVQKAARSIVDATARGDAELTITLQAKMAASVHGVAPGFTSRLLGLANRLLPKAKGPSGPPRRGHESEGAVSSSFLTRQGQEAAVEYNQVPGKSAEKQRAG